MKASLTFKKVAVTLAVAIALLILTLSVSFALTMGNVPVAQAEGESSTLSYVNAEPSELTVTEVGGGITRFGDAVFEIESEKGDGATLIAVYAIYDSEPNVKLTLHKNGSQYILFGVRENFTLVGEWVASVFTATWTANNGTLYNMDGTAFDTSRLIYYGIGIPAAEMPYFSGTHTSSSSYNATIWTVTGKKADGSNYSADYVPANAVSATCKMTVDNDADVKKYVDTLGTQTIATNSTTGVNIAPTSDVYGNRHSGAVANWFAAGVADASLINSNSQFHKVTDSNGNSIKETKKGLGFYTNASTNKNFSWYFITIPVQFDGKLKQGIASGKYEKVQVHVDVGVQVGMCARRSGGNGRTEAWVELYNDVVMDTLSMTASGQSLGSVTGYPFSFGKTTYNDGKCITTNSVGYTNGTSYVTVDDVVEREVEYGENSKAKGFTICFRMLVYDSVGHNGNVWTTYNEHYAFMNSISYTISTVSDDVKETYSYNLFANAQEGAVLSQEAESTEESTTVKSFDNSLEIGDAPWAYDGYSFEGWSTTADGTATGTVVSVPDGETSATYYAIWKKKQYPFVTYDTYYADETNKVSVIRESTSIVDGGEATVPEADSGGNDYAGYGGAVIKYLPNGLKSGETEDLPATLNTNRGIVLSYEREFKAPSVAIIGTGAEVDYGQTINMDSYMTMSHDKGSNLLSRVWKKVDGENLIDTNSVLSNVLESGEYKVLVTASVTIDGGIYGKELTRETLSGDTITCTINPLPITLVWKVDGAEEDSIVYDGGSHELTVIADGAVPGETIQLDVSGNVLETNANNYSAQASFAQEYPNYTLEGETEKTWSITPCPVALAWTLDGNNATSVKHDGEEHVVKAIVTNYIDEDVVRVNAYEGDYEGKVGKGTYVAVASGIDNSNYTLEGGRNVNFEWVIEAILATASWEKDSYTYNGSVQHPSLKVSGFDTTDTVEFNVKIYKDGYIVSQKAVKGSGASEYTFTTTEVNASTSAIYAGDYVIKCDAIIYDGEGVESTKYDFEIAPEDQEYSIAKKVIDGTNVWKYSVNNGVDNEYEDGVTTLAFTGYKYALKSSLDTSALCYNQNTESTDNAPTLSYSTTGGDSILVGEYVTTFNFTSDNYELGGNNTISWEIVPKTLAISWALDGNSNLSKVYNGSEHTLVATLEGVVDSEPCVITLTEGTYNETNAGTYTASVKGISNINYALPQENSVTWYVTALPVAVEWSNGEFTYNGRAHTVTASVTNLALESDVVTFNYTGNTQTFAGSNYGAQITGIKDNANYTIEGSTNLSKIWNIAPKTISLEWAVDRNSELNVTYNGVVRNLSVTAGDVEGSDMVKVSLGGQTSATNKGSYTATATGIVDNSNYALPEEKSVTWSIMALPVVVTWTSDTFTYNGETQSVTAVIENAQNGETVAFTYAGNTQTNVGSYEASITLNNDNYTLDGAMGNVHAWEIIAKEITINWTLGGQSEFSLIYDGVEHVVQAEAVGAVGSDLIELTLGGTKSAKDVGSYEATASFKEAYSNYVLAGETTKAWSITQREAIIKWLLDGEEKTSVNYDGNNHVVTAQITNAQNGESVTITAYSGSVLSGNGSLVGGNTASATGSYETIIQTISDSKNYSLPAQISVTWEIAPNAISIEFIGDAFTYNGEMQRVTAVVSGIGASDLGTLTMLTDGSVASSVTNEVRDGKQYVYFNATNAGDYKAIISGIDGTNKENYTFLGLTERDFSIAPLTIMVEWDALGGVYAKDKYFATAQITNKAKDSDEIILSYQTTGDEYAEDSNFAVNAGEYETEITAISNLNYTLDNAVALSASWSISAKLLTAFSWSQNSFVYTDEACTVTASLEGGALVADDGKLYDGDVINVTYQGEVGVNYGASAIEGNSATNAGEYVVTILSVGNANYYIGEVKTDLIVARKDLIITSTSDWAKTYDKVDTYTSFAYEAIENSDVELSASFDTAQAGDSALTFVLSGTDASNYAVSLDGLALDVDYVISGNAYVVKAGVAKIYPKTVTAVGNSEKVFDGTRIANAFSIESGIIDGDVVNVSGTYESEMVGDRNVTLSLDNANYVLSATTISGTITPKVIALNWVGQAEYEYNAKEQGVSVSVSGMVEGYEESLSATGSVEKSFINNTKFNLKNAGDYAVTIALKANTNYTLEGQLTTKEWSISKKVLVATWNEENKFAYNKEEQSYAPVISGVIDGDNVEISVTGTVATNAGTYNSVISAITGTDSANYELPENATKEWNIEKAEILGIVFNGEEFTYDGNVKAINVSATTTQFGDEVIVVYTGAESENQATNAGEYDVIATIEESQNYQALTLRATLKIAKAEILGVTIADGEYVYDGTEKSVSVDGDVTSYGDAVSVTYSLSGTTLGGEDVSLTGNAIKSAGEYVVVAVLNAGANYEEKTLSANLTISAKALAFVWGKTGSESGVYDGKEHGITFLANGVIEGDDVKISLLINGESTVVNAGETFSKAFVNASQSAYAISVQAVEGTDSINYVATGNQSESLSIAKRTIVVEGFTDGTKEYAPADKISFVYAKSLVTLTPVLQEGSVVEGEDVQINVANNAEQNVGSYKLSVTLAENENYTMEAVTKAWEITPKTISISWEGETNVTYDGEEHEINAKASGNIDGESLDIVYADNVAKNAGTYTAKIKSVGNANYKVDSKDLTKTFVIKPAEILGVSLASGEYLYDGSEYGLTVSGTKTQFGDKISVNMVTKDKDGKVVENEIATAGEYKVFVTITAGDNYVAKTLEASLVIKAVVIESPKGEEDKSAVNVENEKGFAPGTTLEATSQEYKLTEKPEVEVSTIKANEKVAMVYNVSLLQNGTEVTLEETITIRLLVPENLANTEFRILNVANGEEAELAYTMDGEYVLVQTDSIATFVFVYAPTTTDYLQAYLLYIIIAIVILILAVALIIIIAIKSKKHVIRFVTGGVEVAGGNVGAMSVRHGSKVVLPEPSVSGIHFEGWYSDKNCTKKANLSKEDGFTPLYAKSGLSGRKGQGKLPNAFTDNLEFKGWYTDETYTQKADLKKLGKKDAVLYAKWGVKRIKSKYPLWIDED